MWNLCKQPECEAYTARPDGDYCESCRRLNAKLSENETKSLQKRAQLLSKPRQVRKRVRPVSEKRKEINVEYFKLVEQFKKDEPLCKANVNEYCTKNTDDPHHKRGRGNSVLLLDVSLWLPVCRSCHSFIEANPEIARQKGWSFSRLATTEPHKI